MRLVTLKIFGKLEHFSAMGKFLYNNELVLLTKKRGWICSQKV
jgi:hypothetical protein